MKRTQEQSIEDILEAHPYLIDQRFPGARVLRQPVIAGHRPDLMIEYRKRWSIVELKRDPLNEQHILQIKKYLDIGQSDYRLARTHYLITKKPRKELPKHQIRHGGFIIVLAFLGQEIPLELSYDRQLRIYRSVSSANPDGDYLKIIL
ncbi:MAG: hypothetical protein F9K24_18195 [Leptonema illini]|jgi:hypothetical protein|uniref:Uncharacterized protein n=1 Tax=Leptonema illini TaxID=183 RepID=A0A833GYF9_9LEPT|nr:MAG: hypothetical protein F9K24_18195 [Leptonema illini]